MRETKKERQIENEIDKKKYLERTVQTQGPCEDLAMWVIIYPYYAQTRRGNARVKPTCLLDCAMIS